MNNLRTCLLRKQLFLVHRLHFQAFMIHRFSYMTYINLKSRIQKKFKAQG